MTSSGRWGWFCAAVLAVLLLPCRGFAIDKLLIVNGTNLTMKPGQTEPFVGYILVGDDGKIKAVGKGSPQPEPLRAPLMTLRESSSCRDLFPRIAIFRRVLSAGWQRTNMSTSIQR